MKRFVNRLIKKATSSKTSIGNLKKKLIGEELVSFVENHRQDFDGNGDQLCVEAGYGEYTESGDAICDFKPFVKELSKVMDLEE